MDGNSWSYTIIINILQNVSCCAFFFFLILIIYFTVDPIMNENYIALWNLYGSALTLRLIYNSQQPFSLGLEMPFIRISINQFFRLLVELGVLLSWKLTYLILYITGHCHEQSPIDKIKQSNIQVARLKHYKNSPKGVKS